MTSLTQFNQQTMNSKDFLNLINSVRAEFGEPLLRLNKFNEKIEDELDGDYYTKSVVQNLNNTESVIYELTLDQCMLIGMRESKSVRKNVLAQLKEKQEPFDITNPAHLLQAIEIQAKQNIALQQEIAIAAPKVQYFDTVADVGNLMTASTVGKKLGMSAQALNKKLEKLKVYDLRHHGKIFAQWFIDKGFGEIKKTSNGFNTAKFTNKGEQWIIEKLNNSGVAV